MSSPLSLLSYEIKVLEKVDDPAGHLESRQAVVIEPRLSKLFGVRPRLARLDGARIWGLMQKARKSGDWIVSFKAPKLSIDFRVGSSVVQHLGDVDLGAEKDATLRRELIARLKNEGLINAAEVAALNKAYPDYDRLKEIRGRLDAKRREFDETMQRAAAAKKEVERLQAELATEGG